MHMQLRREGGSEGDRPRVKEGGEEVEEGEGWGEGGAGKQPFVILSAKLLVLNKRISTVQFFFKFLKFCKRNE